MLFGEQIRAIRLERGFTMTQVAGVAGIDTSTLCKFETEKNKISDETYTAIFKALKMEKITEKDYKYPNIEEFKKMKKAKLKISRSLIKKGLKTEEEHRELLDSFIDEERAAKDRDYKLEQQRKIKQVKEDAK